MLRSARIFGLVILLGGCQGAQSPNQSFGAGANGNAAGPKSCEAVIVESFSPNWSPLPAAADISVSAEVQAARDSLLGADALNPNEVKLWWYGVSAFIASLGGHLFLLDAWEIVGFHANYSPIEREDLVALQPEAIFIGHGHFDHAADMGYVAGRTGATLIAGEGSCASARSMAAEDGNENAFDCLLLGNTDNPLPGTQQRIQVFADMEPVTVLRHTHSNAAPEDLAAGGTPAVFVPELLPFLTNPNFDPAEILRAIRSLDDEAGNSPEGGTWSYHFKVGDFTLLWSDTAGPIADDKPFGPEIQCQLDHLPACVDVQTSALTGFGSFTSGLRDIGLYPRSAHPQVHLPNHHDAWAPFIGGGAESYEDQWRAEVATFPHPPEIDYLKDPEDYMRVRSYRVTNPRWQVNMPGSSCATLP